MLNFLKKYGAYIKVGIIILITGAVITYVWKKNSLSSGLAVNDANAIAQSGLTELSNISSRIRDSDRETNEALKRSAERNRQLSNSVSRAEAGVIKLETRAEKIEIISNRTAERNREITDLSEQATRILSELRASFQ